MCAEIRKVEVIRGRLAQSVQHQTLGQAVPGSVIVRGAV